MKLGLSTTSTQSPLDGGVNWRVVEVENVPIMVAAPVPGLYHHAVMELPSEEPFTVTAREEGRYAMIDEPSEALAAVT